MKKGGGAGVLRHSNTLPTGENLRNKADRVLYMQYIDKIEDFISTPQSLKKLAVHAVRRCLGQGIHMKVHHLEIPAPLYDDLMLAHDYDGWQKTQLVRIVISIHA